MAPSFDFANSGLFCAEDNASICYDFDDEFEVCNNNNNNNVNQNHNNQDQDQNFVAFLLQSDECLISMFDREREFLLGVDYLKRLKNGDLDLVARKEAINWIEKVQSHYNFGPLCYYLSVSYLDRFLSTYELPKGKAWMMQLLSVACLSIAAKIDENDVPFSLDLQVCESKFVFEAKTIQRMELLVMSTLNWRMQSVTPFSFIDDFLYKLTCDQVPSSSLIFQAIQLILCTIKEIELLEFKPSEIAASVAIFVTQETKTVENPGIAFASFSPQQLQKEKVMKCVEMMRSVRLSNRAINLDSTIVPQSPNGVLDVSCMSYKSDDTSPIDPSWSHSHNQVHAPKRRKLDNNI